MSFRNKNTNSIHVSQNIYKNTIIAKIYLNIWFFTFQMRFPSTLFCVFFFFLFNFSPTRGVNRNLFYLRLARAALKGQACLTVKVATDTVDHGARDKNE